MAPKVAAKRTTPVFERLTSTTNSSRGSGTSRLSRSSTPTGTRASASPAPASKSPSQLRSSNKPADPKPQDSSPKPDKPDPEPSKSPRSDQPELTATQPVAAPRVEQPPSQPAPVSEEEQRTIAQLMADQEKEKEALHKVEEELLAFSLRYKAINATERALHFSKRTEETLQENKKMRKDIDLLRNADRVMVSLRDTVDTLKKHHRIRTAHIRQKIATIELIAKRCSEQRAERTTMLSVLQANIETVAELAETESRAEKKVTRHDPLRCLAHLLRFDGEGEEFVEELVRNIAKNTDSEREATIDLEAELARLANSKSVATGDSTATMEELSQMWSASKQLMLAEYDRLCEVNEELEFHSRRGTFIKSVSQLPEALSADESTLRDLALNLRYASQTNVSIRSDLVNKRSEMVSLGPSFAAEIERKNLELAESERSLSTLETCNNDWRATFAKLQQEYAGETLPIAFESLELQLSAEPVAPAQGTPVKPFSQATADRLHSSATVSRKSAVQLTTFEALDRQRRTHLMSRRPVAPK